MTERLEARLLVVTASSIGAPQGSQAILPGVWSGQDPIGDILHRIVLGGMFARRAPGALLFY